MEVTWDQQLARTERMEGDMGGSSISKPSPDSAHQVLGKEQYIHHNGDGPVTQDGGNSL